MPSPTADSAGREPFETCPLGPRAPPTRSCRLGSSAYARTFRSGIRADRWSVHPAQLQGVQSSRPVESGSESAPEGRLFLGRPGATGGSSRRRSWVPMVAIAVLSGLISQITNNLTERDDFSIRPAQLHNLLAQPHALLHGRGMPETTLDMKGRPGVTYMHRHHTFTGASQMQNLPAAEVPA